MSENKPVGNEELKPCPFCGAPAATDYDGDEEPRYFAFCSNKECLIHDSGGNFDRWNSRASAPVQGVISRAEIGKDLRQMVNGWRTEAARLQLKADSKGVSRHINTEAQAVEIEYGLTTKAEGYRLCAIALENMLNWHGIEQIDSHDLPATSIQATPDTREGWQECISRFDDTLNS